MKTCQSPGDPHQAPRSHPWTDAASDSACRYYDFVREPALIREVLEDFHPFAHKPAVQTFYGMIESLNGADSNLETNDCALSPPEPSSVPQLGAQQCEGRVMILFRDPETNLSEKHVGDLRMRLHLSLEALDPTFEQGMIGTTLFPVRFLELVGPDGPRVGQQLMVSFWAWGDSSEGTMKNLNRLFGNLHKALVS